TQLPERLLYRKSDPNEAPVFVTAHSAVVDNCLVPKSLQLLPLFSKIVVRGVPPVVSGDSGVCMPQDFVYIVAGVCLHERVVTGMDLIFETQDWVPQGFIDPGGYQWVTFDQALAAISGITDCHIIMNT
ncbi:hypothetical protein BaRGS_00025806, partial [Batillaria attramentaria]